MNIYVSFLILSNLQYLDEMTPFHSLYRRTTSDKMEWLLELLEEVVWKWKAYDLIKKCHGVKQNAKKCAIAETECNEILSLYHRKTKNWSEEREGMGEREKRED